MTRKEVEDIISKMPKNAVFEVITNDNKAKRLFKIGTYGYVPELPKTFKDVKFIGINHFVDIEGNQVFVGDKVVYEDYNRLQIGYAHHYTNSSLIIRKTMDSKDTVRIIGKEHINRKVYRA